MVIINKTKESAEAKGQFKVALILFCIRVDTSIFFDPPSSAGVIKYPRARTNTSIDPYKIPGTDKGKNTCQKAFIGLAPIT